MSLCIVSFPVPFPLSVLLVQRDGWVAFVPNIPKSVLCCKNIALALFAIDLDSTSLVDNLQ